MGGLVVGGLVVGGVVVDGVVVVVPVESVVAGLVVFVEPPGNGAASWPVKDSTNEP